MMEPVVLQGWGAIEAYLGRTRKTLLRNGYPVRKLGGVIWARSDQLEAHRLLHSHLVRPAGEQSARPAVPCEPCEPYETERSGALPGRC